MRCEEGRLKMSTTLLWKHLIASVLLTQPASHLTDAARVTAAPPVNIRVTDPGHLGYLAIEWSQPDSLQNLTDCTIRYQLRYYDTYVRRWKSVRTLRLSYMAQFDLEKPVQVRMLTLLNGACTNGTETLGEEVMFDHTPEPSGVPGSRVKGFHCVYFNKEHMDCTWEQGSATPSNSKHYLYYWHREMKETEECPEYIPSPDIRRGCRFLPHTLLEFSEVNMCVNGSSSAGPLSPAYFSLEVQNHVKPAIVSNLQVVLEDGLVQAQWAPPAGPVPEQCLEYELETTTQSTDGRMWQWTNETEDTSSDFLWEGKDRRSCFRVRSKVNGYCADEGFWSEWSQSKCITDTGTEYTDDSPGCNLLVLFVILAIVIIVVLIFFFILWILRKMWMNKKEEKQVLYPLYQEKVQKAVSPLLVSVFQ